MSLTNDVIYRQSSSELLNPDQSSTNSQCRLYADDEAFHDYLPNVVSCNHEMLSGTQQCHQIDKYNEEKDEYADEIKCQIAEECEFDVSAVGNDQESSESLSSSVSMSDSEDSLNISESESITDVTPLHSPYCHSPLPKNKSDARNVSMDVELHQSENENSSLIKFPASIPKAKDYPKTAFVRRSMIENKTLDMNELLDAVKQLETHQRSRLIRPRNCVTPPLTRRRKCVSFSNDEICNIDQENQRLFKKLISIHSRTKSKYHSQTRTRQTPSLIPRRRPQQTIEMENRVYLALRQ
ncbi:cilia- and flagella-associated protein 97-like isoform X2 [Centruroides sculpturatus]|uniref:cilia- and flagella-associated protein 97-like isoform X2 n=1 Tax=Centruroides sculpturatus TaxID=218467 RepID=UPI000C6E6EE5|nr:cilia- and flagella-associated protein 97-like isoform X2 [Centruroides sculpturatus]